MRKLGFLGILIMVISFTSCVSNKDMTYLQGVEQQYAQYRDMTTTYSLKIGADDQLAISITSRDNKLISIFNNQTLIGSGVGSSQASTQNTQAGVSYFTVDKDGYIRFPIFGKIKAAGYSVDELSDMLAQRIRQEGYIQDAIVTTRIINYRVTVLGAVRNPGVVQNTTGERMTILEILGKAGDLTNVAFRKNVRVIREQDGQRISYTIDLTDPSSVFNSPAYFVKQNDLIYVEANKSERVKGSTGYTYLSVVGSFVSIVASVASLIISLTR